MKRFQKRIASRSLLVEQLESRTLLSADFGPRNDFVSRSDNAWQPAIFESSRPHSSHGQSAFSSERAGRSTFSNDGQIGRGDHAPIRFREATGRSDIRGASPITLQTPSQNFSQSRGQTPNQDNGARTASDLAGRSAAPSQNEPTSGRIGITQPPISFSLIVATPRLSSVVDTPLETPIGQTGTAANLRAAAADIALESNQVEFEDDLNANESLLSDPLLRSKSNLNELRSQIDDGFIYPDVSPLQPTRELSFDPELQPAWKIDLALLDWLQQSIPAPSEGESSEVLQSYWSETESLAIAIDWNPAQGGFVELLDSQHSLFLPAETPRWVDVALIPTIGMNQPIAMLSNQPIDALPPLPLTDLQLASPISEKPEASEQPPVKLARFSLPAALTSTGILLATLRWRRMRRSRKRTEPETDQ